MQLKTIYCNVKVIENIDNIRLTLIIIYYILQKSMTIFINIYFEAFLWHTLILKK